MHVGRTSDRVDAVGFEQGSEFAREELARVVGTQGADDAGVLRLAAVEQRAELGQEGTHASGSLAFVP
eukprot:4134744-Pleurochrysis_carterae.AAC.2